MPLKYEDFAHYYDGDDATEEWKRDHFATLSDIMECIVKLAFGHDGAAERWGLTHDGEQLLFNGQPVKAPPFLESDQPDESGEWLPPARPSGTETT
jgi:hypothetical protein